MDGLGKKSEFAWSGHFGHLFDLVGDGTPSRRQTVILGDVLRKAGLFDD
jgi:hypothetical protein